MSVKSICGVIIVSKSVDSLARFYLEALQLKFEREEHGGMAPHQGVDIGTIHLGIHPPDNFNRKTAQPAGTVITFDVDSLEECHTRIESHGGKCIQPAHDEGFGTVASYLDPEGNQFEIVELSYKFQN